MLWELSLSDNDADKRIVPIFVNNNFVLRPMAGKRIMDVFLDPNSKLTVGSRANISNDEYEHLEQMCMEFAYDTFVDLKKSSLSEIRKATTSICMLCA